MASTRRRKPEFLKYFFEMGPTEKRVIQRWYRTLDFTEKRSENQKHFLHMVRHAFLACGKYRIATIEPYVIESTEPVEHLSIDYAPGQKPCCDFNVDVKLHCIPWIRTKTRMALEDCGKAARTFAPEYGSDLATVEEYVLWLAYRIARGYWTLEYVCDDSSSAGNYVDSPTASHTFELAGQREVGGFADGIGNIYKAVKGREENSYCVFGGMYVCSGKDYPVASYAAYHHSPLYLNGLPFFGDVTPVVVLRKFFSLNQEELSQDCDD